MMTTHPRLLVLPLVLSSCSSSDPGSIQPSAEELTVTLESFDPAAVDLRRGPGYEVFRLNERLAFTDYNGDGDFEDEVQALQVEGLGVVNTHLDAGLHTELMEEAFLFLASEFGNDRDLNGDGDLHDHVLHAYRFATGELTNTRLVISGEVEGSLEPFARVVFDHRGGLLVFLVSEAFQGEDINNDGDQMDAIVHFYDASDGRITVTKTEAYLSRPFLTDGTVVCAALEKGFDLNGDGDGDDRVLVRLDYDQGSVKETSLGLALPPVNSSTLIAGGDGFALFHVSEDAQGETDLDGDGAATQNVVFSYDARSERIVNTGVGLDLAWLRVSEGDGWFLDREGHLILHDVDTGVTRNTRIRATPTQTDLPGHVALYLREETENTDLNGDGDLEDTISALYDLGNDSLIHFRSWADTQYFGGGAVYLFFAEDGIGAGDVNGDGDLEDRLQYRYDLQTGELELLPISGGVVARVGADVFASVLLESQEGEDLNEDGDQDDRILRIFRRSDGATHTFAQHLRSMSTGDFEDGRLPVIFDEMGIDLNQDGDGDDELVPLLLRVN